MPEILVPYVNSGSITEDRNIVSRISDVLPVPKHHTIKAYGGVEVKPHAFLSSTPVRG
jgi:hypothetical protein